MNDLKDLNVQLGEYIKQGRKQRRMTQETLAETVGLSTNHISKIECGGSSVKFETILKIFHALGLSVDRFISLYLSGEEVTPMAGDYWQTLQEAKTNSVRYRLKEAINAVIDTFPYDEEPPQPAPPASEGRAPGRTA